MIICKPGTEPTVSLGGPAATIQYSDKDLWHADFTTDIKKVRDYLKVRGLYELRVDKAFQRHWRHAQSIVEKHSDALLEIARELAIHKSLTGDQVLKIFRAEKKKIARPTFQSRWQSHLIGEPQGGRCPTWAGMTRPSFA